MARVGICVNAPDCDNALEQKRITIPPLAPFKCPQCQMPLRLAPDIPAPRWRRAGLVAVLFVLCLACLAASWWLLDRRVRGTIILRLHGSNTIGERLAPALAERFLAAQNATEIHTFPGKDKEEQYVQGTLPQADQPSLIEIKAPGSKVAFEHLQKGLCDIGMASRPIDANEATMLAALGDMTSPAAEHVIGLDGLAIIVNLGNRIDSLTVDQVARIFAGEVTDWSEVGGTPGRPVVYARDENSGTCEMFKKMVLGKRTLAAAANHRYADSERLSDDVAGDPNGIGFIGMPFIRSSKALMVSDGSAHPLKPNALTVKTEDYVLSRRLYLYTPALSRPGETPNPYVNLFILFALSDEGQAIVEAAHFVGQALSPTSQPPPASPYPGISLPPEYAAAIAHAERLPLDFRFRSGVHELDTKALVDIGRLVQLMTAPQYHGRAVRLLGFSDSSGQAGANLLLSRQRCQAVADRLRGEGLDPSLIKGFGAELPVATNDTPEGKARNRRVEVWVQQ